MEDTVVFLQISLIPLLCASLAAVACALPGTYLLLRRQAMMSDAMSHVVLPGIVLAFLITGKITTWTMLLGAAGAAGIAAGLIELIRRLGRIESGAAMGVTFTTLFAAGVVLLEQSDTRSVHLDVEHALYGNLESLIWLEAEGWASFLDPAALAALPQELWRLFALCLLLFIGVVVLWRPLKICIFDEAFAQVLGIPTKILGGGIVLGAALAAVAAFDAVGSILVIALFIAPPATARLMTNSLGSHFVWSCVFAVLSAIGGYFLAGYGPLLLGAENAVSASGMIAVVSGIFLLFACLWGPCRKSFGGTSPSASSLR